MAELSEANENMNRLLAGTGIGIIFVDNQLNVQRFTPAATRIINLIPTDVGRPIGHIVTNMSGYDRLTVDIQTVRDNLTPMSIEVLTYEGEWYLLSIRPYRSPKNAIEGAVITFTEVTEQKNLQEEQTETLRRLAAVVNDSSDAILLQDTEGKILAWNPMAVKMYGWSEEEALDMNISGIVPDDRKEEALFILKKTVKGEIIEPYQTQRITKDGSIVDVWLTVTALVSKAGKIYAIATTEREVKPK